MKMIIDGKKKQAMWVYLAARNFCGCLFLRIGHFFCFAETNFCDYGLGVMKQECGVIVRWRDFTTFKLCDYVNSFPRLSDFTDCGVKHSKYSIKLTT